MKPNYIQHSPIDFAELQLQLAATAQPAATGAQTFFLGRVRADVLEQKTVQAIDYSAYEPMVEMEFEAIKKEFLQRFPDILALTMVHALGRVAVGEVALAVVIDSGHRVQAFEALPLVVNAIKARVPIWKKELLADGGYVWTENAPV